MSTSVGCPYRIGDQRLSPDRTRARSEAKRSARREGGEKERRQLEKRESIQKQKMNRNEFLPFPPFIQSFPFLLVHCPKRKQFTRLPFLFSKKKKKKKSALRGAFEWASLNGSPFFKCGKGNGRGECPPSRFSALRFARVQFEPLSGRSRGMEDFTIFSVALRANAMGLRSAGGVE